MRDYLGRLVILVRDVTRRDGRTVRRGRGLIVTGHWRGRLILADPATGEVVLRHIARRDVCLVTGHEWWREAQPAQPDRAHERSPI